MNGKTYKNKIEAIIGKVVNTLSIMAFFAFIEWLSLPMTVYENPNKVLLNLRSEEIILFINIDVRGGSVCEEVASLFTTMVN